MTEVVDWDVEANKNISPLKNSPVSNQRIAEIQAFKEMQAAIARWIVTYGGSGNTLEIADETTSLSTAVTKISFTGSGVVATELNDEITVTISASSGGVFTEDASYNIYGGDGAGASLLASSENNFLAGKSAGAAITIAHDNIAVGDNALRYVTTGNNNVVYGEGALGQSIYSTNAINNTAIGTLSMSGAGLQSVIGNVGCGHSTLAKLTYGNNNFAGGPGAGGEITVGNKMVCMGYLAGPTTNQTDKLYVNNAQSDYPLIFGDFVTDEVIINGSLEVTDVLKLDSFTLATLPTAVAGGMIYVSDATGSSLTGSQCFSNGTVWIDVTTGVAVA